MSSIRVTTNVFVTNLYVRLTPQVSPTAPSDTADAQSAPAPAPTDTYEPSPLQDTSHDPAVLPAVTTPTDTPEPPTPTDTAADPAPTDTAPPTDTTTPTPPADTTTPTDTSAATDSTTTPPQTPSTQTPPTLPRTLRHGYGYGPSFRRVQSTVLSALAASQSDPTADPDKVVENAIAQYLDPSANPTTPTNPANTNPPRHGDHHSLHSFFHALRQYGISPKDFRADFRAAVRDVRSGQTTPPQTTSDQTTTPAPSTPAADPTGAVLDTAA